MVKKLTAAVLAVLLCVSMLTCGVAVSARIDTVNFALSATDGEVGDTVTVSLSIPAESYFTNATMHLHYDSTALSFIENDEYVGPISPRSAMFMVNNKPAENTLSGAYVTVNGIKKGGVLLKFDFEVLKKTPVPVTLTFNECVGVDENDVEFDVNYTTEGCIVNNDGSLTNPPPSKATVPTTLPTVVNTTTATPVTPNTTVPSANAPVTSATVGDNTPADTATTAPTATPDESDKADGEDDKAEVKPSVYSTVTDAAGTPVTDAEGAVVTTLVASSEDSAQPADYTWVVVLILCIVAAGIAAGAVVFVKKKQNGNEEQEEQ